MNLGIDLGTSGAKAVLIGEEETLIDQQSASLDVSRPRPLWSEQDPQDWWRATEQAIAAIHSRHPKELAAVRAIGLSGQMHGATLLGKDARPLRPAILWNDGRSSEACRVLEAREPASRRITGNLAMPGFTAPKLVWLERAEPACFADVAKVLLPKDWLRFEMTGEFASDLSDASGTLWLDVAARDWSDAMLAATKLGREHMPELFEGSEVTGTLRAEVADAWGMGRVPVVAGAGDQAAGAVGAGVVAPGQASLSLGTSGVYFVAGERFAPNPDRALHAFCHCLPNTWHQMSVILSAASCLDWVWRLTGAASLEALLDEIEERDTPCERLLFLPYLSGERTPHNDPHALGVFFGMNFETDRAALGRSVLEGVAFAFADAQDVLLEGGARIDQLSVIGGGARSRLWSRILASSLDRPLVYRSGGDLGPALGAARLARLGVEGQSIEAVCPPPPEAFVAEPEAGLRDHYAERLPRFRSLYSNLRARFRDGA